MTSLLVFFIDDEINIPGALIVLEHCIILVFVRVIWRTLLIIMQVFFPKEHVEELIKIWEEESTEIIGLAPFEEKKLEFMFMLPFML